MGHTKCSRVSRNLPEEAIFVRTGCGSTEGWTVRRLVNIEHASINSIGDVERCRAIEVVAGMDYDIGKESIGIKKAYITE